MADTITAMSSVIISPSHSPTRPTKQYMPSTGIQDLRVVTNWVEDTTASFTDLHDFLRERAAIERDYANRLESLVKTYKKKRVKERRNAFVTGAVPPLGNQQPQLIEDQQQPSTLSQQDACTTGQKAYTCILNETENFAKAHGNLAEKFMKEVCENIRHQLALKQESRKKHIDHSNRVHQESETLRAEKEKLKKRYFESCALVETYRNRYEREEPCEKEKRKWNHEVLEMNNRKNLYILALKVLNATKKKLLKEDVPTLMEQLREMNERQIDTLKSMWESSCQLEERLLKQLTAGLNRMLETIEDVDAKRDSELFLEGNKKVLVQNKEEQYEPFGLWEDKCELVDDPMAKTYLINLHTRLSQKHEATIHQISTKLNIIQGLRKLHDALVNPEDADQVMEKLLQELRDLNLLQTQKLQCFVQMDTIQQSIGQASLANIQPHSFKSTTFFLPKECSFCQKSIWGIKKAYVCRGCHLTCHKKCQLFTKPSCMAITLATAATISAPVAASPLPTSADLTSSMSSPTPAQIVRRKPLGYTPVTAVKEAPMKQDSAVLVAEEEEKQEEQVIVSHENDHCEHYEPIMEEPIHHCEEEPHHEISQNHDHPKARILYTHIAASKDEITVLVGDEVLFLGDDGNGWATVETDLDNPILSRKGIVPFSYLEII